MRKKVNDQLLFLKKSRYKPKYKALLRYRQDIFLTTFLKERSFHRPKWRWLKRQSVFWFRRQRTWRLRRHFFFFPVFHPVAMRSQGCRQLFRTKGIVASQLRTWYGWQTKHRMQTSICDKKTIDSNIVAIESQVDLMLYRLGFTTSVRMGQQWIRHGKVFVNQKQVLHVNSLLQVGDCLEVDSGVFRRVRAHMKLNRKRLLPLPHMEVNYKILKAIKIKEVSVQSLTFFFPFSLQRIVW